MHISSTAKDGLSWIDCASLLGYLALVFAFGLSFYRRRSSVGEYFIASRQIPTVIVVMGLSAALLSGISYLGVPSYSFRVNLVPAATLFAAPLAFIIVSRAILPFLFKLEVVTAYEYLERRFGPSVRLLASLLFLTSRMLWLTLVTYGPTVALKTIVPIKLPLAVQSAFRGIHVDPAIGFWVLAIGIAGTIFTMLGGMRSVMWTDSLQFLVLMAGLVGMLWLALDRSGLSLAAAWDVAGQDGHTRLFDFRFDWKEGTFWAAITGGLFLYLADFGADQLAVQRYLAAKSMQAAQASALLTLAVSIPISIILFVVGLVLFAFYKAHPSPELTALMQKTPDVLVPWFYRFEMPPGLAGLMLGTILTATTSCLTAGLNSLSASTSIDLYQARFAPRASSAELVRFGRWATVVWGAVICVAAFYVGNLGAGLMELSWMFLGLSATFNIGIFLCAVFLPWVGVRALWCGVAAGAAVSATIVLLGFHWLWYYSLGAVSIMVVAGLSGFLLPRPSASATDGLTYWSRGRTMRSLDDVSV